MGKKRKLTGEEFKAIMVKAMAAPEPTFKDIDLPALDFEAIEHLLDHGRDAAPADPDGHADPLRETPCAGTRKISIRLPNYLLARVRRQAARTGTKYQTLIARTLRSASSSWSAV